MAFNNTVPVTLSVSHDSGTNLITFVITRYTPDSAGLYNVLFLTETIEILASACSHNEVFGQVVTVQNDSQDEFEITTGWYDAVNDIHYASPGQELVDLIDTYIAMNTGGGSTTLYTAISEADALTLAGTSGFEGGVVYRITCDGGTGGAGNGDYFYGTASAFSRLVCLEYYDSSEARYLKPIAEFTSSGVVFKRGDASQSISVTINSGVSTNIDFTTYRMYGTIDISDSGSVAMDSFMGFSNEDRYIITSVDGTLKLSFNDIGIITPNGFVGEMVFSAAGRDSITIYQNNNGELIADSIHAEYAGGPREYVALLSQSGTNAPVATILKNTLGEVPVYAYGTFGEYQLQTSASLFTSSKTEASITGNVFWDDDAGKMWFIIAERYSDQAVLIKINDFSNNGGANDLLDIWVKNIIHIRVYP